MKKIFNIEGIIEVFSDDDFDEKGFAEEILNAINDITESTSRESKHLNNENGKFCAFVDTRFTISLTREEMEHG